MYVCVRVRVHLRLDWLLEGKKLVNVPVVLKAPARISHIYSNITFIYTGKKTTKLDCVRDQFNMKR